MPALPHRECSRQQGHRVSEDLLALPLACFCMHPAMLTATALGLMSVCEAIDLHQSGKSCPAGMRSWMLQLPTT